MRNVASSAALALFVVLDGVAVAVDELLRSREEQDRLGELVVEDAARAQTREVLVAAEHRVEVVLQDVLVLGDRVEERQVLRDVEVDRVRRARHDVEARALLGAL